MSAPFTLNNATTADSYSGNATVKGGPAFVRFMLQVYTAAVYYEIQALDGSWAPETFLGPAIGPINRVGQGIRFRSAAAGVPASVSVDCLTLEEVIGGGDSLSTPTVNISPGGVVTPVAGGATLFVGQMIEMAGGNPDLAHMIPCDGAAYLKTDSTYAALNTYLAADGYPYGSDATHFNVPDKRERVSIGAGNTALGATDGVAFANRHGTRHRHSTHTHGVNDPGHTHDVYGYASLGAAGAAQATWQTPGGNPATTTSVATGVTVAAADGGSGVAADPLDGPAFVATHFYIVYA